MFLILYFKLLYLKYLMWQFSTLILHIPVTCHSGWIGHSVKANWNFCPHTEYTYCIYWCRPLSPVNLVSGRKPLLESLSELCVLRTSVERSLLRQQPVQLPSALPRIESQRRGAGGEGGWRWWGRRGRQGVVERLAAYLFSSDGPRQP